MIQSVRARVTVVALVVTFVALAVAAVALLLVLRSSLVEEIDQSIANRAIDIAAELDLIDDVSISGFPGDVETFAAILTYDPEPFISVHNDEEPDVSQVVAALQGGPVFPGDQFSGYLLFEPVDASLSSVTLVDGSDNLRMVAEPTFNTDELVVVARTLDGVDRTVNRMRTWALIAVPALSVLVGLLVWLLAGRALQPVEAIRRKTELITQTDDLSQRVDVGSGKNEVSRLGRTMNDMLDRIDTSQQRQRRFASDAAHELRSPLASMQAQLDVDLAHPDTVDWQQTAGSLRAETGRMQRLVDDLLAMARAESGAAVVKTGLVDMDDVIAVAAGAYRESDISFDLSGVSACVVRGNSDDLRRLVVNLIANAQRHARSTVTITARNVPGADGRGDRQAIVTVGDDGAGIAEADRERIFERFVRLDQARSRDAGGTGLGLALAREVAVAHGGTLVCTAGATSGSLFTLTLPAA